jgi:TolB protein
VLKKLFVALIGITLFCELGHSQAKIYLDVGAAKTRKSRLALPQFQYLGVKTPGTATFVTDLYSVVSNDLASTGLFINIAPEAYLEDVATAGLKPAPAAANGFDFEKWKSIETEFLLKGGIQVINGQISLEIYAYYVPKGQLILGKKYEGPTSTLRKIAHTFSHDFILAVTGKPSFFKSQIVVGIDDGPKSSREIHLADWDAFNATPITSHRTITVSPAWSRNGEYVAYTAFVKRKIGKGPTRRNPDLFIYEVKTKRRWLVSYRDGLNSGADFLPDNKNLLLTLSENSRTTDIFKMTLDGKTLTPLTKGPGGAMNVEPAVSPDGSTIAFSSDRSGRPMIYTMNMAGGNIQRRTFAGHYNSTPTWSPDGKMLAFAGFDREKDNFDVFVMNVDGTVLLRLTSARKVTGKWSNNEDPAFSPDGRHVLFVSDRTGTKQLYLVGVDGTNERRITYDKKFYSKPKWGPLIP